MEELKAFLRSGSLDVGELNRLLRAAKEEQRRNAAPKKKKETAQTPTAKGATDYPRDKGGHDTRLLRQGAGPRARKGDHAERSRGHAVFRVRLGKAFREVQRPCQYMQGLYQ